MLNKLSYAAVLVASLSIASFSSAETLDSRLIGEWKGQRDADTKCTFLSWQMNLRQDGNFVLTFYADAQQSRRVQTERGTWKASNGVSELSTNGVPTPDVYTYTFLDENRVRYVNTKRDPSGDCQSDYEFTEHRIKG